MTEIQDGIYFIETLEICGKTISVYMDDYGQCYFLTWVDEYGLHEESCGTYNTEYEEYARMKFDEEYRNTWLKSIGIEPRKRG